MLIVLMLLSPGTSGWLGLGCEEGFSARAFSPSISALMRNGWFPSHEMTGKHHHPPAAGVRMCVVVLLHARTGWAKSDAAFMMLLCRHTVGQRNCCTLARRESG